jgi:hypothetical protein
MKTAAIASLLVTSALMAAPQQPGVMPPGFERVCIGMDWRSLVLLRPDAEIMNMMPDPGADLEPDPEKPQPALVEELTSQPFDRAIYSFEQGILVAVMFGRALGTTSAGEWEELVRTIGREHGAPSRIGLSGNQRDQGVLTWQRKALLINVIVPAADVRPSKSVLGLQIMNRDYAERIKAIGVSDNAEKAGEWQDADRRRLEAFTNEAQKALMEKGPPSTPK